MRNPLSQKITGIEPSGIRKFFDIVSEMPDRDITYVATWSNFVRSRRTRF